MQVADLAVADLTITWEREQGVDFTMPFMNLGVTILFQVKKVKQILANSDSDRSLRIRRGN